MLPDTGRKKSPPANRESGKTKAPVRVSPRVLVAAPIIIKRRLRAMAASKSMLEPTVKTPPRIGAGGWLF